MRLGTMKKIFILICLFLSVVVGYSQVELSGTIKNMAGERMAMVSVSVHNPADSSIIKAELSDEAGHFSINVSMMEDVFIQFSMVGMKPLFFNTPALKSGDLGEFTMEPNSAEIGSIEVVGRKPLVQVEADKTVVNVEGTANAIGLNGLEVLRRSPGIVVDNNNNIIVKGKSGIRVYIDGRVSPLQGEQLANFLKNTPSSAIEKIEIITNPSARYDAAGTAGILNIVLKKNKAFGQNLSVGVGYGVQIYSKYNASLNFNKRTEKVNLFVNYGGNNNEDWGLMRFYKEQNGYSFDQKSITHSWDKTQYLKTGMDFYVNDKTIVGFSVNGNFSNSDWNSNSQTPIGNVATGYLDSTLIAESNNDGIRNNFGGNVNYQWKGANDKQLNIDVDYGRFDIKNNNYQPNIYYLNDGSITTSHIYQNNTATGIDLGVAKLDYTAKWKKIKFDTGAKVTQVSTRNSLDFYNVVQGANELDSNRTNKFSYDERVMAAYLNSSGRWKKFGWQLGVRMENTHSLGHLDALTPQPLTEVKRDYTNLFPSAAITFNHKETSVFNLTYSRRIDRPRYQDLNPFEFRIDELSYNRGNAFLKPQYTDVFELSHTLFYMVNTSLSYSKTTGFFTEITDTTQFSRSYIQTRNLGYQEVMSFNLGSPIPLAKWWEGYMNLGVYNLHNRASFSDGKTIDLRATSYNVFMQNTFKVNKNLSLELSGFYNGPSVWGGTFKNKQMGGIDGAAQYSFKEGAFVLRVAYGDLLHTMRWRGISQYGGLYMDASGRWESRLFRVNLTWKIGNQNVKGRERRNDDAFKRVK